MRMQKLLSKAKGERGEVKVLLQGDQILADLIK